MAQRIWFNMPVASSQNVEALVDVMPALNDVVVLDGYSYRVCKVLHVLYRAGALLRSNAPMVYLSEKRSLTDTERRHVQNCRP